MDISKSFPRIHKLSDTVANQIAAGEVVERPSSVVKELIENSIDSAADKIYIDIEQSGISLIQVRDNGYGIHKNDLKLALQPHATSKLSSIADFLQIASLGFRGEALSSIASVSDFILTSKYEDSDTAWSIDNRYNIKPTPHETGTTVKVKNLFCLTPARRKFLKSEKTELLHIQSTVRAFSLSYFSIGFFLKTKNQFLYRLAACDNNFNQRIKDVLGVSFLDKSIAFEKKYDGMCLWGWLGENSVSRSQSDRQFFYVNGRYVYDKHVNHAIRLAYENILDRGRFPSYVLHLQIDPASVDINVHPAKTEVRFSETRKVHDFIYGCLLENLNTPTIFPVENLEKHNLNNTRNIISNLVHHQKSINKNINAGFFNDKDSIEYTELLSGDFFISSIDDKQYLVDLLRTRKLLTEHYLYIKHLENGIIERPILVPVSCEISKMKLNTILKCTKEIKQWGFELGQISPDRIIIRKIPACLVYADTILLVIDLLECLQNNKTDRLISRQLASHVNDSGIKLSNDEVKKITSQIKLYNKQLTEINTALPWVVLDKYILRSVLGNN